MSKKTPVKKSRRRLKRSIRRSLAAVLMITAIAVAAIPVPENYAAGEDSGSSGGEDASTESYQEETYKIKREDENESGQEQVDSSAVYSLTIYNNSLRWQYKIKGDKVLRYNSSYPIQVLTLSKSVPINYKYITQSTFDNFCNTTYSFSVRSGYYSTPGTPDTPGTTGTTKTGNAEDFLDDYFGGDQTYQELKKKVQDGETVVEDEVFSKSVRDLNDPAKEMQWYCECNGYPKCTLESVSFSSGSLDGNSTALQQIKTDLKITDTDTTSEYRVYIPKLLNMEDVPADLRFLYDDEGYLYSDSNSIEIKCIGNYAFAESGILVSIELPDGLKSIGEGAFMKCNNLTSVSIPFLKVVPDAAFKNCTKLGTVNWFMDTDKGKSSQLTTIGREAFFGTRIKENTASEEKLTFPDSVTEIGQAAFYGSPVTQIEFETAEESPVSIGDYAFYNNRYLESLTFNDRKISKLGNYCFAVGDPQNSMKELTLPNSKIDRDKLGKKIFSRRSSLQSITVPARFDYLGKDMFEGCTGLAVAEFIGPASSYEPELFNSVNNSNFYVTGPATTDSNETTDNIEKASNPRTSTWAANKTAADQYIPYKYTLNGKDYYEVCVDDKFILSIDQEGTLMSCNLKEGATPEDGILVIPDNVGDTTVKKIDSNCFKNKDNITQNVAHLTIGNYIEEIADSTFASWVNLEDVEIGKSIKKIGANAFAGCSSLTDVTLATPNGNDYTTLTIGEDAFATNSGKLTIHGDLVDGYAPFEYAVKPSNFVSDRSGSKYRICYQSRWDSPSSKHMAVLYGEYNGSGYVTLVDYPLYQDFFDENGNSNPSEDLEEHMKDMQEHYYEIYGNYTGYDETDPYREKKRTFAGKFKDARGSEDSVKALYTDENVKKELYGPWINPSFCNNWQNWLPPEEPGDSADDSANAKTGAFDWLFEPITAYAADKPTAFYDSKIKINDDKWKGEEWAGYDFLKNYIKAGGNRDNITFDYYDGWSQDEENMIRSTEEIVIPAGVESIDINAYYKAATPSDPNIVSNKENYKHYFSKVRPVSPFVSDVAENIGLFNGRINDCYPDAGSAGIDKGDHEYGNDRITKVDMSQSNVAYLPDYAFNDCEKLGEVSIPAACAAVGKLPFKGCTVLGTLTSGSESCPAQNGLLYQKKSGTEDEGDGYELVECIIGKGDSKYSSYGNMVGGDDEPYLSQVSSIAESAFEDCGNIQIVDLTGIDNGAAASKLKVIPTDCFKNCDELRKVNLPLSTVNIKDGAFSYIRETSYHHSQNPSDEPRLQIHIRGKEVEIDDYAFAPKKTAAGNESTIDMVSVYTYEDTAAARYVLNQRKLGYDIRLGDENEPYLTEAVRVDFWDYDGTPLCSTITLADREYSIDEEDIPAEVTEAVTAADHRPGYKFTEWRGTGGEKIGDKITGGSVTYIAQYKSDGTFVNGRCAVYFIDGIDGSSVRSNDAEQITSNGKTQYVYYVWPGESFESSGYSAPIPIDHDGYKSYRDEAKNVTGWFLDGKEWKPSDPISSSPVYLISLYQSNNSDTGVTGPTTPTPGGTPGTTPGTSNGATTNTSNKSTSSSTSSTSTSSSSTSSTSTTSGSSSEKAFYTVTVENGHGSGSYAAGSTVIIAANTPAAGMQFSKWTTESNGVNLASVSMTATTFTMPENNVTVTANYVTATTPTATPVSGTGTTTPARDDGNTRVDITKPGISNKDLATADVNGSTDNFIVKISETDEATQAVSAALINKYGNLDNILYYAMDISLYDSTGTTKITDVSGLSIDITIPIPDALITYGGNNMAGAVVNGNQLEDLSERFTTVNGVPMVTFTATHFSPYTIYVDTGNLVAGELDVTPKTGDPIHPKWFLSIGLACLSVILFIKKDKARVKVKA